MQIDARKYRILQAIIDDYIMTAIPVGSRTISKKYEMGLSSATIRNEMSDLEELGYLDQPHVSAGRIPSAKAYRLYVDKLLQDGILPNGDSDSISDYFQVRARQMEDVISHTAKVLSGLTHYTAVVMSPRRTEMRIRNIQLVPVSTSSALAVIVTDGGVLRDAMIPIGSQMDPDTLYTISRNLTEMVSGMSLTEAIRFLSSQPREGVVSSLTELLGSMENETAKTQIALGGQSNILNFPEYNDIEKAKGFLSVLETKDRLVELLSDHGEMDFTVRIGQETGIPEWNDCSLVTASYRLGDHTRGTIGVIGPVRMQYGKVLGILNSIGQQLTNLLEQEKE